jgi:hypothetical protein
MNTGSDAFVDFSLLNLPDVVPLSLILECDVRRYNSKVGDLTNRGRIAVMCRHFLTSHTPHIEHIVTQSFELVIAACLALIREFSEQFCSEQ